MTRRLVIAVEPPLLATSLAAVFGGDAFDVVIGNGSSTDPQSGDLAIVSGTRRGNVSAPTVISLPDVEGNSGVALLWTGDQVEPIQISNLSDLLRVVESVPV